MEINENFHFPRSLNTVVHEDFGFNRSNEIREKWILTQRGNMPDFIDNNNRLLSISYAFAGRKLDMY